MLNKIFIYLRRMIYISFGFFDDLFRRQKPKILILCYHGISNDKWVHNIKKNDFIRQIKHILNKYNFISLDDLYLYLSNKKDLKETNVILTFDDGFKNILDIKDFLFENKIKPALFIISDNKRIDKKELGSDKQLLNKNEIKMLEDEGWIIGCHSATHRNFYNLSQNDMVKEIVESKLQLENILDHKIKYFAYPRGKYSTQIVKTLKKNGYIMSLSMDDGVINQKTDFYKLPRIGINNTLSFLEFKYIASPSVIYIRKIMKKLILNFI